MKKNFFRRALSLLIVSVMLLTPIASVTAEGISFTVTLDEYDWDAGYAYFYLVEGEGEEGEDYVTAELGSLIACEAYPNAYYQFVGWYDGDELVSNAVYDELYVTKNCTLTPVFEDISKYDKNHTHDDFLPWGNANALPDTVGRYYLTTNVTLSECWHAPDGIVLCLNGYVVENTGTSATITVDDSTQAIITDCNSTNQTHDFYQDGVGAWVLDKNNYVENSPYSVDGGVITGVDRCVYVNTGANLHMFGGNAVGATGKKNGAGVHINDGGAFFMYGGSVQGNVNTNAGDSKEGVKEYDGGGGIFVNVNAYAYLLGDSYIANNTALYTNNGGGVYNYRGIVYFGDNVRIENNRGDNGAVSNYQTFVYDESSPAYVYSPLSGARIGVSVGDNGRFLFSAEDDCGQYIGNFFSDDVRNRAVEAEYPEDSYGECYGLALSAENENGYVVTAGTRGAGTATVNNQDGSKGVIVAQNTKVTLRATPKNEDYSFVGWYNLSGQLLSTNPTYSIGRVKSDQHVVAYFTTASLPIEVSAAGSIHLFNSGLGNNGRKSNYRNPAFSTITNNGQYLYFYNGDSRFDQKGPVGVPFHIDGDLTEKSIVTMKCYDVDENYKSYSRTPERDYVYLVDLTTHTQTELGYLTGQNETWTNTSFTIPPEELVKGHTYQLYLDDRNWGWEAWIDTASISIGAMATKAVAEEEITGLSLTASINASRSVSGNLKVVLPETGTYNIEYKATHLSTNDQLGSLFTDNTIITAPEETLSYSFTLESGAPTGAYRIDAFLKDTDGNVIKTVSATAGYSSLAVTYDANGGTNNLPEDTNDYAEGDTVTVLFDYVPSRAAVMTKARAAAEADVFAGWSTDPNATEPMYTKGGVDTFNIGNSDVTLFAVYHNHSAGEVQIEKAVAPGCTVNGSHDEAVYCVDCGEEISRHTIVDLATGHQYGDWIIDVPPTDDAEGSKHKECSACGDVVTEAIPANGHTYSEVIIAPTCTEQGYTNHICQNEGCGDSYITDYTDALGHDVEIISGKTPTCTEDGLTDGERCLVCGAILAEQEEISALGHTWNQTVTSPTCIDDGQIIRVCRVCGETETEIDENNLADPIYHRYVAIEDKPPIPGVENSGYVTYKCFVCGDSFRVPYGCGPDGEPIDNPDDDHIHVYGEHPDSSTPPTCTEPGEDVYICIECGFIHREYVAANGHRHGDWIIDVPPTDDAEGSKHKECSACGDLITESIPANGHSYSAEVVAPTCTEKGYTEYTCTNTDCGHTYISDYTDALGHTERTVQGKAATCTEDGLTDGKECSVCGEIIEEQAVIPATGHTPSEWIVDLERGEKRKECIVCGAVLETVKIYSITVNAEEGGSALGGKTVDEGENVTIKATAANGYQFIGWYKDNALVSTNATYTIKNVAASATYVARFVLVPQIIADANHKNLVMHANGHTIENVKIAYIGDSEATVSNWTQFSAVKEDDVPLKCYTNVADATEWAQERTGFYACYIRTTDKKVYYSVDYITVIKEEEPTNAPYIAADDIHQSLVMHANGYTIENVKIAYIGDSELTVTNWTQFAAAKVDSVALKCYTDVDDATKWMQATPGYYACYIRTADKKVYYSVDYIVDSNPTVTPGAPYIIADATHEKLVMHTNGHTVENVKIAYIGDSAAVVTNWTQFSAAKVDSVALKCYSNVADATEWMQENSGYYACYIRTAEKKVYYTIDYIGESGNTEGKGFPPCIIADGNSLVMNAKGYDIENVKIAYIGQEEKTVFNWDQLLAAQVEGTSLMCYTNVADGTSWTQERSGYYACYIRTTNKDTVYCTMLVNGI